MGEYLKLFITSWPPWIFALGTFFLLMFKGKIGDLINRITDIGKSGITAATAAMKDAQAGPVADPRAGAEELMKALDNALVREMEEWIGKELDKRGLKPGVPETTRVLTRYTAVALIAVEFETIESNIFGSQIEILEELNGVAPEVALPDRLRVFYDRAAEVYPDFYRTYSFDTYMAFLVARTLVLTRDGGFGITVRGRTYLTWRANQGKRRRVG